MIQAYLLTGESGIGKTTTLKEIIDGLGTPSCGGFYTESFSTAGEKCGYRVVTVDGRTGLLADVAGKSPIKFGKMEAVTLPHKGKRQAYRIRRRTVDRVLGQASQQ